MKTTLLIVALAAFSATAVLASNKNIPTKPAKGLVKKNKPSKVAARVVEKDVVLTGSYIKRDIHRSGLLTDGPTPVYVLDQTAIELSGGADLREVLNRTGFHR